jgi:hypothetical protein
MVEEAFADVIAEIEDQTNDTQQLLSKHNTENLPQFQKLTIKEDKQLETDPIKLIYHGKNIVLYCNI